MGYKSDCIYCHYYKKIDYFKCRDCNKNKDQEIHTDINNIPVNLEILMNNRFNTNSLKLTNYTRRNKQYLFKARVFKIDKKGVNGQTISI